MSREDEHDHYLKAVTELGDAEPVVSTEAIYSTRGIKLIERGVSVDSRLYEQLVRHKLKAPIERSLETENAVRPKALRAVAHEIVSESAFYARLTANAIERDAIFGAFDDLPLPSPVAFKLTVARARRPGIYRHSLKVALLALYLGARQRLARHRRVQLCAAAVLHDLGMLHIDPALLAPGRVLDPGERRHLYAHPLTGAMLLEGERAFAPEVSAAILEHHERLDGTGYPRGLQAGEISPLGRVLMLAEIAAALLDKEWDCAGHRLSLILRLNRRQFDPTLVEYLVAGLQASPDPTAPAPRPSELLPKVERLVVVFERWKRLRAESESAFAGEFAAAAAMIDERLELFQRALSDAGFFADQPELLNADLGGDPQAAAELAHILDESCWQLRELANGLRRRWPALAADGGPGAEPFRNWFESIEGCADAAPPGEFAKGASSS
jgi:HD-GYP domain-containing protein (c-di-GMP phosphodiesterase class II)